MPEQHTINADKLIRKDHKVRFFCTLQDGERIFEQEGPWQWDETGSPWKKVIAHTIKNDLEIISVGLFVDEEFTGPDGKTRKHRRTYNLHGRGNNPRLPVFYELPKPIDFEVGRVVVGSINGDDPEDEKQRFTVATAIYPTHKTQIWVSEYNPRHCWTVTLPS